MQKLRTNKFKYNVSIYYRNVIINSTSQKKLNYFYSSEFFLSKQSLHRFSNKSHQLQKNIIE